MKKLIIINPAQFGYHIDAYYYCKYLKDEFKIVYICWDHGRPLIVLNGVQVVYVSRLGNMINRTLHFLSTALNLIRDRNAIVFIKYFKAYPSRPLFW